MIKSIPDNQGWSAGGYNFYVAEDGNLTKGRPGEIPASLTGSLPDGAIIGGVMYFNRPTKPTERSAGVPLVVRDRWYNTSDGTEWFWNGTYWLSTTIYTQNFYDISFGSTKTLTSQPATNVISTSSVSGIYFTDINVHYTFNGAGTGWDSTNYTDLVFGYQVLNGNNIPIFTYRVNNIPNTPVPRGDRLVIPVNTAAIFPFPTTLFGGYRVMYLGQTKTGSGTDFISVIYISFRAIHT